MAKWTVTLLPALVLAAWLPAQAQDRPAPRGSESIAGKAAAKAQPSRTAAATPAERKRPQATAAAPAAATAAPAAEPVATRPAGAGPAKEKSSCHHGSSDA